MNAGRAITAAMTTQRDRELRWVSQLVWCSHPDYRLSSEAVAHLAIHSDIPMPWLR